MSNRNISENALKVLQQRYFQQGEDWNALCRRVADAVASAEREEDRKKWSDVFYDMIYRRDFLPNSPTLMNAGTDMGQLSACFVLPVEDSMEGIFDAIKNAALIHKSGGGTGFSFSRLRASGATVKSTGGVASGPISFMQVFDAATDVIKQGGKRRGANMGVLMVDHPDILQFINCKEDQNKINNFNLSVGLTADFMEAVENGDDYPLIDPHTKQEVERLNAREVFDIIVKHAWDNGEPGILFMDRINDDNKLSKIGAIEATNPCGY